MRILRFAALGGLVALLLLSGAAPVTRAAPTDQWTGWTPLPQPQWDPAQAWYGRTVVVQPTGVVNQSVPVTVLVPSGLSQPIAEPTLVNTYQQTLIPSLAGVVPPTTLQNGLQVLQVTPHLSIVATPQFFCPMDATDNCVNMATQLAQRTPGWTTVITNGPQGMGAYVAHAD